MASVNKVILIGNLGKDPELRYTPGGQPVASFPIATTERWNDKNGQAQKRTEWHNIVVWNKQAELANQYLKKGRPVYIEGRITTRSWDDRDGNKRYKTEIVANTVQFLSGGSGGGADGDAGSVSSAGPVDTDTPAAAPSAAAPGPVSDAPPPAEDDLPF